MYHFYEEILNMKKNVLNVCFIFVFLLGCFSCTHEDVSIYASYGVLQNVTSENNYEILTDRGNILVVTESNTIREVEEGKRVLANYEILSDKNQAKNIYEVKVNGFYNLLSKPLVNESFILDNEDARRDSIGNDPFIQIRGDFGGDYINIDFEVYFQYGSTTRHLINLIYDDTNVESDTIRLTLRHNAYGETLAQSYNLISGWGRCSFKIADLLPEGITTMPVILTWEQYEHHGYGSKERSATKTFQLRSDSPSRFERFDSTINLQ